MTYQIGALGALSERPCEGRWAEWAPWLAAPPDAGVVEVLDQARQTGALADAVWAIPRMPLQPDVLARLAGDADWFVRRAVAWNPATPPDVLARLAGDEDWQVRQAVAENPATPADALARLAGDADADVRQAVARQPATSTRDQAEEIAVGSLEQEAVAEGDGGELGVGDGPRVADPTEAL